MRRLFLARLALGLLASCTWLARASGADAPESSKISFDTADGVLLRGTWYPSAKDGSKSPAVMLVHKLGGDRTHPGWEDLAQALQQKGFAVLSFDLRGCGESTVIKEDFWKQPYNTIRNIEKASPKKEDIDFKQFKPSYYPVMVNDLAAAKHALELKNNAKECNCGDCIIIAAKDGATLASLFLVSEWVRRPQVRGPNGFPVPGDPMGKDIAGAVFISPQPMLGSKIKNLRVPINGWLGADNNVRDKTGFYLLYGGKDAGGAAFTKYLYDTVLRPGKDAKKKAIYRREIADTNLAGADLLKKTLKTESMIVNYCADGLMQRRAQTIWVERRDLANTAPMVPVNQLGCKVP